MEAARLYRPLGCPGKGIDRKSRVEFDGSPLRALRVSPAFDRLFLGDKSEASVRALRARISPGDRSRVEIEAGDCNDRATRLIKTLSRRTLGLAFVDPQGFEVTFSMLKTFAQRHIDLLLFFPSVIGIRRNLRQFVAQEKSPMDAFWGGRDWRELPPARLACPWPPSLLYCNVRCVTVSRWFRPINVRPQGAAGSYR